MEAVIFMGTQGTGKTTFYGAHFLHTRVRISLDVVKTRNREAVFLRACLDTRQRFVVDNTNPVPEDCARYIISAKAAGFRVAGYYFESRIEDALRRNAERPEARRVVERGVRGTHARLQQPTWEEGWDALFFVRITEGGGFSVEKWQA